METSSAIGRERYLSSRESWLDEVLALMHGSIASLITNQRLYIGSFLQS